MLSYQDEAEMLTAWRDFVHKADPDVIIGYNISNFDFPYLLDRAAAIKAKNFTLLGRINGTYFASSNIFTSLGPAMTNASY